MELDVLHVGSFDLEPDQVTVGLGISVAAEKVEHVVEE